MKNKIFTVVILVITSISLLINYLMFDYLKFYLRNSVNISENDRLNQIAPKMDYILVSDRLIDLNNELEKKSSNNEFIDSANETLSSLSEIRDELIRNAGGINPINGKLMNAVGIPYVQKYFFTKNNIRSNTFKYFQKETTTYIKKSNDLKKEISLSTAFRRIGNLNPKGKIPLFKNMTLVESLLVIRLIQHEILIDKYIYLTQKENN